MSDDAWRRDDKWLEVKRSFDGQVSRLMSERARRDEAEALACAVTVAAEFGEHGSSEMHGLVAIREMHRPFAATRFGVLPARRARGLSVTP